MILRSLAQAVTAGQDTRSVMAWRGEEACRLDRFQRDVACVAASIQRATPALLMCTDAYAFLVGFFGVLYADGALILPRHAQQQDGESQRIDDAFVAQACTHHADPVTHGLDPERCGLTLLTSGSTGESKRIEKTLGMFMREIAVLDSVIQAPDLAGRVYATVPYYHLYGLTFALLWPFATGRAFVTRPYLEWETLVADLAPGSVLVTSPAHLGRIAGMAPLEQVRKPQLVLSSGAPLPLAASVETRKILGSAPVEIFGSTETGAMATRTQREENEAWTLLPTLEMRCDAESRLIVRTPFVGPEWIETSDVIVPTAGGFLHRGRADRIVKIEGKRVSLASVEAQLRCHRHVEAATVLVLEKGKRLAAVVILNAEGKSELKKNGAFRFSRQIKADMLQTAEAVAVPRQWRFVEAFPTQTMGKVSLAGLRALFGEDA